MACMVSAEIILPNAFYMQADRLHGFTVATRGRTGPGGGGHVWDGQGYHLHSMQPITSYKCLIA